MASTPKWNGSTPMMTFKSPSEIILGISGHPSLSATCIPNGSWGDSNGVTLAAQIELLQELGADSYRYDIYSTYDHDAATNVMQTLYNAGIKSLLVIGGSSRTVLDAHTDSDADLQDLYDIGYALGADIATNFSDYLVVSNGRKVLELSNECDIYCAADGYPNWLTGDSPACYNLVKMKKAYKYLKGLNDGVKSVIPTAKTLINTGFTADIGFHRFCKNPAWMDASLASWPAINYDIIGWHPYFANGIGQFYDIVSNMQTADKNILRAYSALGEFWFTECNCEAGSYTYTEAQQADFLGRWLRDIFLNSAYPPHGIYIYDLIDDSATPNIQQAYGLVKVTGTGASNDKFLVGAKKPAFYSIKANYQYLRDTHTNP